MPDPLKKFIDWDLMFEKSFLSPIHRIYENMGKVFTLDKETNILDLF
jgi:shikimate kinase